MSRGRRRAVALCLAAGAATAAAAPDGPPGAAFDAAVTQAFAGGFAGVIGALEADGTMRLRAAGFADAQGRRPLRPDDRWPWASVTKQVVAALVLADTDAGGLALDAPLATVLPAFRGPTADRLTVRHLLQHRSGLPNPEAAPTDPDGMPSPYRETGRAIAPEVRAGGLCAGSAAEPAGAFEYNNCDYWVLGALLEHRHGRPWAALVRQAFDGPIARAAGRAVDAPRAASDGAERGGTVIVGLGDDGQPAPPVNLASYGAAGALVGTPAALLAFDRALLDGRWLSPGAREAMWRGDPAQGFAALGAWSYAVRLPGCARPVAIVERRGDIAGVQVRNLLAPAVGRAWVAFTRDGRTDFGEPWRGEGLAWRLSAAVFCGAVPAP